MNHPNQANRQQLHSELAREDNNSLRKLAFFAALGLIFVRYSLIHETLTEFLNTNTYIMYIFAIPAIAGMVISGGIARTLTTTPPRLWLLFTAWMIAAIPFSSWQGGSFTDVWDYVRTNLPILFVIGGLATSWKETRSILYTIGLGGIVVIFTGLALQTDFGGNRSGLEYGTVANPNDFAGHLIMVLPLVLFIFLQPPQSMFLKNLLRIAGGAAMALGLYQVLLSASRGALVGLAVMALIMLWHAKPAMRIGLVMGLPLAAIVLFGLLPNSVRSRLGAFSTSAPATTASAAEAQSSTQLRRALLEESLRLSIQKPIFGVGPGQFGSYTGGEQVSRGGAIGSAWRGTHNSFTQISSENGLPGFMFYLAGLITSFKLLQRAWKRARSHAAFFRSPELQRISTACLCLTLAFVGFSITAFFLNFGYFFYFPALVGLATLMSLTVQREISVLEAQTAVVYAAPREAGFYNPQAVRPFAEPKSRPTARPFSPPVSTNSSGNGSWSFGASPSGRASRPRNPVRFGGTRRATL